MATDEVLPPACAFAISVLTERDLNPDAVPEEAVEAAQRHMATCIRCLSSPPVSTPPRKKRKVRRVAEIDYPSQALSQTLLDDSLPLAAVQAVQEVPPAVQEAIPPVQASPPTLPVTIPTPVPPEPSNLPALISG